MRIMMWAGLVLCVLGVLSLVVPIPHTERNGIKIGDASVGVTTQTQERVSPIVSAVLIIGGIGLAIAGKPKN
jgi:hypothetical protein